MIAHGKEKFMSLYAEVRFKGIVKEEFRDYIEHCVMAQQWQKTDDPVFAAFMNTKFSNNIFNHVNSYVQRWNENPFDTLYVKKAGEWTFHLQYNTRWDGFDLFDDLLKIIIPYGIEKIIFCQTWVEDESCSQNSLVYDLKAGRLKRIGFADKEGTCHFFENKEK